VNPDFEAEEIRSEAGLVRLAPEWEELWRRCPGATPFQSPAWLVPWWRHFHPGELFTVAVRRGRRLVGLAPFYLEDGALGRRLLPVGISLSDYHDVLLDPEVAEAAGAALVAHVAGLDGWDSWELEELAPGAAALALPVPRGCEETGAGQSACPVLILPDGLRAASDILSPQKRRKLAMARNRAERRGGVALEEAGPEDARDALELLFRLHKARWSERGEAGLINQRVEHFQREALPGLARAGLVRLYTLRIGGEPAASYYGFLHRDRAYGYLTGFDPAFSFESPSVTLLAHVIERAAAEGAREMHFLRGREPYKYEWGAIDRWNRRRSFRRAPADAAV
jgi:CelD/BcsL family acetyltransferase involved in cellulose biosynthesis